MLSTDGQTIININPSEQEWRELENPGHSLPHYLVENKWKHGVI